MSKKTYSQNGQDLWVLENLNEKRGGYFVDFGACDGVIFSNTYLLEKEYDWKGIVCEPNSAYHEDLRKNRNCSIDTRCVFNITGQQVPFLKVEGYDELSGIVTYAFMDEHSQKRMKNRMSLVDTVSLSDLLKYHNAPETIDYLSIDTEGSEFDILYAFDFDQYDIRMITVEHNWTVYRQKIFDLLTSKGYTRAPLDTKWDDWYIRR